MRDHEHAGFSWYPTSKPNVFNPYNVSDRVSRKTWYDNVTYPDIAKEKARIMTQSMTRSMAMQIVIKKKPHTHNESNSLFTRLNCPECNKRK
jgi:hypothetical protein